jgi:REP element-mobilizing transposase RayT
MDQYREYYHRHLPHWQPSGATFFVTFRLKGSMPFEIIQTLQEERERDKENLAKLPKDERETQNYLDERRHFSKWDHLLDKAAHGPLWLAQPEIAKIVKEALHYRNGNEYDLFAFCIMSNHVHVVFAPLDCKSDCQSDLHAPLNKIMQSLKRHTARKSNIVLGREGTFWQDESYDHVIRDSGEFDRIINYVLENPVKAGLVTKQNDWPWTFCKSDCQSDLLTPNPPRGGSPARAR